ncbi:O-antigen translocase [Buttiauxella warmboldiae]|nr:O-antigen translocase [Buttiauxella warmboldiae]
MLTVLRMLLAIIIAKAIAVYTGPTGLAMLGQFQNVITSLNGLVNASSSNGVIKFTAEYSAEGIINCTPWWKASVKWSLGIFFLIFSLLLFFAGDFSYWLFNDLSYSWLIIITGCSLPFVTIGTLITSILNGRQQYREYIKAGVLSTLITATIMIYMIVAHGLKGALIAAAIQNAIVGAVILVFCFKQSWFKFGNFFGRVEIKHILGLGGFILMAVTSALTVPISFIFVRNIIIENAGWGSAGEWQAVWRISETYLAVITIALSSYYLPRLSELKLPAEIQSEMLFTLKFVVPFSILAALGIFVFRDFIIAILFTPEFRAARDLFLLQLCGDVIKVVSWVVAYPMISGGKIKLYVFSEIFFSLTFVLLTSFFVEKMGVQGANLAFLVNYLIYLIVMLYLFFYSKGFLSKANYG